MKLRWLIVARSDGYFELVPVYRFEFMPDCTHAGVAKGTTCPLCGRTV